MAEPPPPASSARLDASPEACIAIRQVLDAMPQYAMLVDDQHHIVVANAALGEALGEPPDGLVGAYCPRAVHGYGGPFPGCPLEEAVDSGAKAVSRCLADEQTGRSVEAAVYVTALRTVGGRRVYLHLANDVTDRARLDVELEESRNLEHLVAAVLRLGLEDRPLPDTLDAVLRLVLSAPWLPLERKGSIHLLDESGAHLELVARLGLEEAACRTCKRVPVGRCLCGLAAATGETVFSGHVDERHTTRLEGVADHGHYCVPIRSGCRLFGVLNTYLPAGHPRTEREVRFLSAIADAIAGIAQRADAARARAKLEQQLRHAQKMDAIGRMASGVAHDFNNTLAVVLTSVAMLREELSPSDPLQEDVSLIEQAGRSAADLTRRLLAFASRQPSEPTPLDPSKILRSLERLLGRVLGEDLTLVVDCEGDIGWVFVDPGQLEQVLVNLAVNARHAMGHGGTLRITLKEVVYASVRAAEDGLLGLSELPDGAYVVIAVRDTGCGIAAEDVGRVFEPFFTTKQATGGSGLGLALVHGIAAQAGGAVTVESTVGEGTTFRLFLPRYWGAFEPVAQPTRSIPAPSATGRSVLLVEDQPLLRTSMSRSLTRAGYVVTAVADGSQALAALEAGVVTPDLVVTDLVLPGIDGVELIRSVRERRPRQPVLVISGYADAALSQQVRTLRLPFLAKPFTAHVLARKVLDVLSSPR